MAYYPESSIITTQDGLHCQVYMSEHPDGLVIVKPKYIPTDKISSSELPFRYIAGRRVNRLNMWIDPAKLKKYLADFKRTYPEYIYWSPYHKNWFFAVPQERIEKFYDARRGLAELIKMPPKSLDEHLKSVVEFVAFLQKSDVSIEDMGVTFSTLVGHYYLGVSDINLVVYGRKNFWQIMKFLAEAEHPKLRWKTDKEWIQYHKRRGRSLVLNEDEFLFHAHRKKWEGFFNDSLFLILGIEKPGEIETKWGEEKYEPLGLFKIRGVVKSDEASCVRPGCYELEKAEIIGMKNTPLSLNKVVFFTRSFVLQARKGEIIEAQGLLEKVNNQNGDKYYRLVLGYFDSFVSKRREKEYIKVLSPTWQRKIS